MSLLDYTLKNCQCGREVELQRWKVGDDKFCVFIECSCGINMASRISKKEDKLAASMIKIWNTRKPRKKMEGGIKSCFCGSKDVHFVEFDEKPKTSAIICYNCYRETDEIAFDGHFYTKDELKEIWNHEG